MLERGVLSWPEHAADPEAIDEAYSSADRKGGKPCPFESPRRSGDDRVPRRERCDDGAAALPPRTDVRAQGPIPRPRVPRAGAGVAVPEGVAGGVPRRGAPRGR